MRNERTHEDAPDVSPETSPETRAEGSKLSDMAGRLFDAGAADIRTFEGLNRHKKRVDIRILTVDARDGRYEVLEDRMHGAWRLNYVSDENVAWPRMTADAGVPPVLAEALKDGTAVTDGRTERRYAELHRLLLGD